MTLLKRPLKFVLYILIGIFPMLVFFDLALGIQLDRDYNDWTVFGFIFCMQFYAELYFRVRG